MSEENVRNWETTEEFWESPTLAWETIAQARFIIQNNWLPTFLQSSDIQEFLTFLRSENVGKQLKRHSILRPLYDSVVQYAVNARDATTEEDKERWSSAVENRLRMKWSRDDLLSSEFKNLFCAIGTRHPLAIVEIYPFLFDENILNTYRTSSEFKDAGGKMKHDTNESKGWVRTLVVYEPEGVRAVVESFARDEPLVLPLLGQGDEVDAASLDIDQLVADIVLHRINYTNIPLLQRLVSRLEVGSDGDSDADESKECVARALDWYDSTYGEASLDQMELVESEDEAAAPDEEEGDRMEIDSSSSFFIV